MKSNKITRIFKEKCPLFAAGGNEAIINLFSNSLEHMGNFCGHKRHIYCLCTISNMILASGSYDMTIKIWSIADRAIMSTLSGHTHTVNALCSVNSEELVSGSWDNSLIIWSKSTPESPTYSHRGTLRGHTSNIQGIIRLNNREIMSGEWKGDLRMWNIAHGLCLRHIPRQGRYCDHLYQMKQHTGEDVVASYWGGVNVWGTANWSDAPIQQFNDICKGHSIEFLDGDLLLRGGEVDAQLQFIDYAQTASQLPTTIQGLHSNSITAIQRIAKNIVVTASGDGYLKVVGPISRKVYLKFKIRKHVQALVCFY